MRYQAVRCLFVITGLTALAQAETNLLPALLFQNGNAADPKARYILESQGFRAVFGDSEIRLKLPGSAIQIHFPGANSGVKPVALEPSPGQLNFITGSDPARWTHLQNYSGVVYRNLYPGIDMVWRVRGNSTKTEFIVARGSNPNAISMFYSGIKNIRRDESGELILVSDHSEIRDDVPAAFVETAAGLRQPVRSAYRIRSDGSVGFDVEPYDHRDTLVIDPALSFSTFLAGSGHDSATAVAADSAGNAYIAGWTESLDFPVTGGLPRGQGVDMFIAKFTAANTLAYCTFLGGSGDDQAFAIAVDGQGNAVIAGSTTSSNMPLIRPLQTTLQGSSDAFVAKLNSTGTALVFSTYFGGLGADAATGVALDSTGNIYVAGSTTSTSFRTLNAYQTTLNGQQNAFVFKLDPTGGTLLYSTYLGGSALDAANGIAVDTAGNAYVTGSSQSTNFPLLNPIQSSTRGQEMAFVTKLNSTGKSLVYSSVIGGSSGNFMLPEMGTAIAVDATGAAYIAGVTSSTNFSVVNAAQATYGGSTDAFAVKINPAGTAIVYSTYFGGSSRDWATGIAPDSSGGAYFCGYTASADFPLLQATQNTNGGLYDGFVVHINSAGALVSSTYLGGNMIDSANAIAVDNLGDVFVAGHTESLNFPLVKPVKSTNLGQYSAFLAKFGGAAAAGLGFFPLPACRVADTRASQGKNGLLGPPSLGSYAARDFPILSSSCGILSAAQVYSLNATVVPPAKLDFLSVWPSGQSYPGVSTLNSPDGSVLANAILAPAGSGGAVTILGGQATDLILDTNGYFAPSNGQELLFHTIVPCRVADTRSGQGKTGAFGPPALTAYGGRDFPISSSSCGIPSSAQAYSLNITALPHGRLDFLSTWASGQSYPGVSTVNSPDGSVIANAAIVAAGTGGAISVVAGNPTDMIIDANGYFAPSGSSGGLHFYPLTPCRVVDTRSGQGKTGSFGPPSLAAWTTRDFPISSSACNVPSTAQAYALNMTAVPQGHLDFLSTWPSGQAYPNVSTLMSPKAIPLANAAIVAAGTNGAITVLAGNPTDLIIDINGYFAP